MGKTWTYRSGDWNCICDICGIKIKASKTKQRWDGFITCPSCWEPRHSQDFIKVRQDKITVPFLRPRSEDLFVTTLPDGSPFSWADTLTCTPMGKYGEADVGTANCAQAGIKLTNDLTI